jgi:hypothetical protein
MSGGSFDFNDNGHIYVAGTFNQSGGNITHVNNLLVDQLGTYNLSGTGRIGYFFGMYQVIKGTFNQSGGVNGDGTNLSLSISGGTYNLSGGKLQSENPNGLDGSSQVSVDNNGTLNVSGNGTFGIANLQIGATTADNSRLNLSGGSVSAYNIVNNGTINYSGGGLSILPRLIGPYWTNALTNNGTVNLSGTGTRTIAGDVINNGTFKTTHTTAAYTGTFTNNGAYISTAAAQYFNDLIIGQNGYLKGQFLDRWYINGNFMNSSTRNTDWNTSFSYLSFLGGTYLSHDMYLTGIDYGAALIGYSNNFSWGKLDITGNELHFYDGNNMPGAALYLGGIYGLDINGLLIKNIYGDGFNIYYLTALNPYLGGLTYDLLNGGHLIPISTPEPSTMLLLGSGLVGLVGFRRKFRK